MLAIRPVTYEVETSLSPKRVLRKLDGDLIEHRPTINILSQSKFMKNHRDDTIFYGYRTDSESFLNLPYILEPLGVFSTLP